MSENYPVITIDGPSGTGKGTISLLLAKQLGWHLLDSGALYRVLAFAAKQHAVAMENEAALEVLAAHLDVQFDTLDKGNAVSVILEGEEVTDAIRSEECGNDASKIAAFSGVRNALLARQRAFGASPGLVTDGRDMGTVVFPQAALKIYLTADLATRVQRRYRQLKEKGMHVSESKVLEEVKQRDKRDSERAVAPLRAAKDAIIVDTTKLTIEQVVLIILQEAKQRFPAFQELA